jgi:hypothetical protein
MPDLTGVLILFGGFLLFSFVGGHFFDGNPVWQIVSGAIWIVIFGAFIQALPQ